MSNSLWPQGLYSPWNSPSQNTREGSLSLPQGIFPTQESNWGLLHCRQIPYQLGYPGSPNRRNCVCLIPCYITQHTILAQCGREDILPEVTRLQYTSWFVEACNNISPSKQMAKGHEPFIYLPYIYTCRDIYTHIRKWWASFSMARMYVLFLVLFPLFQTTSLAFKHYSSPIQRFPHRIQLPLQKKLWISCFYHISGTY